MSAYATDVIVPRADIRSVRISTWALACALAAGLLASTGAAAAAPMFTTPAEQCIVPAATYHHVNPYLLRAILRVESSLNPRAINRNRNGTVDVGISQINTIHFRELASYGIAPQDLQDACVGTYVGAWHLARVIAKYGNTWEGVARYHSATPAENRRYQALLWSELVRSGVVAGRPAPVTRFGPAAKALPERPLDVYDQQP